MRWTFMAEPRPALTRAFVHRSVFIFGLAAALFVTWQLTDVFLLMFGAVIVAVLLRSLADPLSNRTPLGDGSAVLVAALIIAGIVAAAGWLFGSAVGEQVGALVRRMPSSADELQGLVSQLPFGSTLADQLKDMGSLAARFQGVAGRLSSYAINIFGAGANLLLLVFAGIYLALKPAAARDGVLLLLPQRTADPVREAMDASGQALRLWLLGTLADMTIVGVLTGIGTALIGLPSPLALGLFAALASFVPIIGPIVSVIPGILLALQEGPQMVLWTVLVYFGVQQVESNLFYPFIQRRAVGLPPFLTLAGVLAFGVLLGPLGVMFATPLLVVLMVMVKMLYIRNTLHREVKAPGEKASG